MLDIPAAQDALRRELTARAEPEYREGSAMVMKTSLEIIGVRAPDLRQIVKEWGDAHRRTPWNETLALIEALWVAPSLEEHALALLLLDHHRRRIPELAWECFDRWRRGLDTWGTTDGLGCLVFGPWLAADLDTRRQTLSLLIADRDLWSRRLALVGTVPLNRKPATAIPDLTLELIDRVKHERDPMITKAVSWALRELTKTHKPRVVAYLVATRAELAPLVIREVENKLRTGLKSGKEQKER
jgi:3-methyladenine DNA glycosylase AlkD